MRAENSTNVADPFTGMATQVPGSMPKMPPGFFLQPDLLQQCTLDPTLFGRLAGAPPICDHCSLHPSELEEVLEPS